MNEEIIGKYKQIIEYAKQIEAAIKKNEWEYISVLISRREELIQQTGKYMSENKPLPTELKEIIDILILEIQKLDNKNIKLIETSKIVMEQDRIKLNVGQKVLNAYQSSINKDSRYLDKKI